MALEPKPVSEQPQSAAPKRPTPMRTDPKIERTPLGAGISYRLKRIRSNLHRYHNWALGIASVALVVRLTLTKTPVHEFSHHWIWYCYEGAIVLWLLFVTMLNTTLLAPDPYRWVPGLRKRTDWVDHLDSMLSQDSTPSRYVNPSFDSTEVALVSKFASRAFPMSRLWPRRREKLFLQWLDKRRECIRWIVDPNGLAIGYTCIIPISDHTRFEIQRGLMTWYSIRPSDIAVEAAHVNALFVQAICIDKIYNGMEANVDIAIASFSDHLAELLKLACPAAEAGKSITIMAEATSSKTRAFLQELGYDEVTVRSEPESEHESGPPFALFEKTFLSVNHGLASDERWLWRMVRQRLAKKEAAGLA
jgi:hypothetical protein